MEQPIEQLNWSNIYGQLNDHGYALAENVIMAPECDQIEKY